MTASPEMIIPQEVGIERFCFEPTFLKTHKANIERLFQRDRNCGARAGHEHSTKKKLPSDVG